MADDTRQPPSGTPAPNNKPFTGSQWDGVGPSYTPPPPPPPPQNANLIAGGTENTAGGKTVDVGLLDAAKTIKREDWNTFHRKPCIKDSFLTGIGAGAGIGAVRAVWRASVWNACSWAVGTFCLGSISVYNYCQWQRFAEKEGMKRAIEIIDRKSLEKKQKEARMERARELRRQKKEDEDVATYARLRGEDEQPKVNGGGGGGAEGGKPWYKVW